MTRRTVTALLGVAMASSCFLYPARARAEHGCGDFGSLGVLLTASGSFLAGSLTSATAAGILAAGNEDRDFGFSKGFWLGELGVAIYSVSYAIADNLLGCPVADAGDGFSLGVVIGGAAIGALVPWGVYAAADQRQESSSALALELTF